MGDHTQVDEINVGGKERNKHAKKKLCAGLGTVGKTAVVGIRDQHGEVRATLVKDTTDGTLEAFVGSHAPKGGTVVTDSHKGYSGLDQQS